MRILFSTCSAPQYMAPPVLAEEQVNVGPFFPERIIDGRVISLPTGRGEYDLATVARRIPVEQQPDAVVCMVDASWFNTPKNLAAFKCPKIALVADTHHMERPLLGMIQYLTAQKFDRIIFLYTRHHVEFFRSAGLENLFWLPGLTFPHSDAVVRGARLAARISQIALIGQSGNLHQRRLALAGALASAKLPLVFREASQRESLAFYGSSLIGFNATANADLNLRAIEITAAGSLMLMDRLSEESGIGSLWKDGEHYVSYSGAGELIARSRYYLEHPLEARRIGENAAAWFDRHIPAERRRRLFEQIVQDGRAEPMFDLGGERKRTSVFFAGQSPRLVGAMAFYEHLQQLHSTEETVRILTDGSVPSDVRRICETLPRVQLAQSFSADETPDYQITSLSRFAALGTLTARNLWCWDADKTQADQFSPRLDAAGLKRLHPELAFWGFPAPMATTDKRAEEAKRWLQMGALGKALDLARQSIQQSPESHGAYLVMAELALLGGKSDLFAKMIAKARILSPDDARVGLLELAARQPRAYQRPAERILHHAIRHLSYYAPDTGLNAVERSLELDPQFAEAMHWLGRIRLCKAQKMSDVSAWRERGAGLNALRKAAEMAPDRAHFWIELGHALREAGLFSEAVNAFQRGVALDPRDALAWFSLGGLLLKLDQVDQASATLAEAVMQVPDDRYLRVWLGHARKRQGRLMDSLSCYLQAYGNTTTPPDGIVGRQRAGRRRVIFAVQHGPSWTGVETVYRAFVADPSWETLVVAIPYLHPFYNEAHNATDEIYDFLEQREISYVHWEKLKPEPGFADVVFLQNPYDITRPPSWQVPHLQACGVRLAYIPYGLEIGGGERNNNMVMNLPLQQMAWRVFARSERQRQAYAEHCLTGNAHVIVTGHPKLDALRELNDVDTAALRRFAAGRKIVAWNPHFDIQLDGSRFGCGFSTFLRWWEFLEQEFIRRSDLALVVRPHPLFFATMEDRGIIARGQLQDYFARGVAAGRLFVDQNSSHLPLFAAADAMMSDISSFVLEFAATGKPLLFLHNPYGPPLNSDGAFVREHLDQAERETEIISFLDRISAGDDVRAIERERALTEYLLRPEGGAGLRVKQSVDQELAAETAGAERVAV